MLIHLLLFAIMLSFTLHVLILILYFINKSQRYFFSFIATAFSNIVLGITLTMYAFKNPDQVRQINFDQVTWILSGFVMFLMVSFKGIIITRVVRRSRDPQNYSLNYFGKKVYSTNIVSKKELGSLFITIPFFLLVGAYFFAKLFNQLKAR